MSMRTFIQVKAGKAAAVSSHARYMSERERNPSREEPDSRPIFTHDRDGLKHTAADRYLAGGESPKARSDSLLHVIISFNSYDRKELEKLERGTRGQSSKSKRPDSKPKNEKESKESGSDRSSNLQAQIDRDLPYARAVRQMMKNLEERTDHSDLRYALSVHRHTTQTHVHLLLRREHTDKKTGEKIYFDKKGLPAEFVNGRDERGKARGGLLDHSLSDALDTMIPRRNRRQAKNGHAPENMRGHETTPDGKVHNLNFDSYSPEAPAHKVHNLNFHSPTAQNRRDARSRAQERTEARTETVSPAVFIARDVRLTLPPRYSTTRRQPEARGGQPSDSPTPHRVIAPGHPAVAAAGQPASQKAEVHNLNSNVHEKVQKVNFGPSQNSPERHANRPAENIFPSAREASTPPPEQAAHAKAVNAPIKPLVILQRPNLVPVHEKPAPSRTRSR